jgi:arylsulfatase A-like enzyme
MTLAALDFARRDGVLLGWGAIIAVALSMVVLGTLTSLWLARRGWVANLLWTASLAFVTLSGANFQVRPLWIEPTVQDAAPRAAAGSQAPNVVLVVLDTVRAENLSLYGYARRTSPNLDALAAESLVFDRAISSGNYTLPSHASLFTGLLPGQHGAREFLSGTEATGLSRDVETLASRLRASGFTTGGVSANFVYLAPWTGLQRGLEIFDDRPRRLLSYHTYSFSLRRSLVSPRPPPRDPEGWDGDSVTAAGSHFATRAREPFFLFLNYLDAHVPYAPLAGRKFRGDGVGSDVGLIPDYDSAIAYTDSALGKLVDGLRRASILDRTVLVITSDHGEFLGEHGFTYHHRGAYEEVLHVPLLVRYPKGLRRGRVQRPFGLHEVHRLILDLVESRPTGWVDAQEAEPRVLAQVWGRITSRDESDGARGIEPGANVVYLDSFKMIGRSEGENELYDLSKDPREEHNLLILPTPEIEVLAKRMQAAIERLPPSRLGEDPNATSADIEGLKALGYISVKKPVKKPGAPQ